MSRSPAFKAVHEKALEIAVDKTADKDDLRSTLVLVLISFRACIEALEAHEEARCSSTK